MDEGADCRHIQVEPSGQGLGAEVVGLDLSAALAADVFEEVYRAWLEHQVLYFRDQKLSPAAQAAFGRRFGELDTYPFIEPLAEQPEIIPIIKEPQTRFNFGGGWHSDTSYQPKPPKATMLLAREVPARGGDTCYANLYAAYETLSPGMRRIVDGLQGVFTADRVHGGGGFYRNADHPMAMHKDEQDVTRRVEHPIVRTHPESGRKALYVSYPHIERFKRMTREESRPILEYLAAHAVKPEHTFRLRWEAGTLALWDNRCVLHYALNDYPGQRREMHRLTIKGDAPR
ncbi:MAG: TauD/TfdA family dioxygenase [Myxococcales bacterium]|nr:TauD/TfdA family dioxygenase [Myxococcales bacterium]